MSAWDTTALLASIRRRCGAPASPGTGTTDLDLLAKADEELRTGLLPTMLAVREEFYTWPPSDDASYDLPLVPGRVEYPIPSRAIGGKLRDVVLVDSSISPPRLISLDEFRPEDLPGRSRTPGKPYAFLLRGNTVAVVPAPPASVANLTLRLSYHMRPSQLVASVPLMVVTGIDYNANQVAVAASSNRVAGDTMDFVKGRPHFDTLAIDYALVDVTGSTYTFDALPLGLVSGDYVCLGETVPVPQLPVELHPVLAQRVANSVLADLGATERLADGVRQLERLEAAAAVLLTPRVEGEVEVIISDDFYPDANGARRVV